MIKIVKRKVTGTCNKYLNAMKFYLWQQTKQGKANRQKLWDLKDCYHNRRCFILGNGPSLMQTDLTALKNELTIGSNGLFLIFDQMGYKPTFLTVEDPLVAEDRSTALNAISGTIKIFPFDLKYCLQQDPHTIYINFIRGYKNFPLFSKNFNKKAYWGGTVSFLNLQLAYYIGCKTIYLIGFDHNYTIKDKIENNIIYSKTKDENHFHPDYFGPGFRWHDPKVWKMEAGYKAAKKILAENDIKIFNATAGGKLEVFERKKFEVIF
jgi:hypothetical protein